MHGDLPEAYFGKFRIWRPKEVLYRYVYTVHLPYPTINTPVKGSNILLNLV
jgi:hypothetical protein